MFRAKRWQTEIERWKMTLRVNDHLTAVQLADVQAGTLRVDVGKVIQSLIDSLPTAGGVIEFDDGWYYFARGLSIVKPIELRGKNSNRSQLIAGDGVVLFTISYPINTNRFSHEFRIRDLAIKTIGAGTGVGLSFSAAGNVGIYRNSFIVDHCFLSGYDVSMHFWNKCITATNANNALITNSYLTGKQNCETGVGIELLDNTIEPRVINCFLSHFEYGIRNNVITSGPNEGLMVDHCSLVDVLYGIEKTAKSGTREDNLFVTNCHINSPACAILTDCVYNHIIMGNLIFLQSGVYTPLSATATGVYLNNSTSQDIFGSQISNNTLWAVDAPNSATAVLCALNDSIINNNIFKGFGKQGIIFTPVSANNEALNNLFRDTAKRVSDYGTGNKH